MVIAGSPKAGHDGSIPSKRAKAEAESGINHDRTRM